ncbi:MAG: thioredoxin domain-containing protein [Winogradskyella sp.]|uniref:thioredoxin domain-containing protein n=1 Tax=Winogradskyella sp. TaxID=1883156 RepID=UPI0017A23D98|nr:thioredoxin domain-containing protein [Winogradskyella sp.]MBT8245055.1 thioredoxin domain-containing protein [Winogradskyella sp.]NNK22103.1 thioredoxin domain-containing protein [Winogradskyella sp.]
MYKRLIYYTFIILLAISCLKSKDAANTNKAGLKANDLINETSPYLLQHAYNPVEWKAWNNETLQLAQKENKLIIISVGYSACHWCHVMEEESFENDSIAKLMNDNFVSIKVDREERPDVDQIYMNAVQLITGSGGWPLNCIALPDGRPVFGGTYFTKKQWKKVLVEMSSLYKNDPYKVTEYAKQLTEGVKNSDLITLNTNKVVFSKDFLKANIEQWKNELDNEYGGQNKAPKFPMPSHLNFILRYSHQYGDKNLQNYITNTLTKMSNGGIYDQIGGGFSRYSTDKKWHIPHFEKMLYDNAQLISLYSKAYQITKNDLFKTIVTETLEFIDRELTQANGAFYSSIDADSKTDNNILEEGVFYRWTKEELKETLKEDYNLFSSYYNINVIGKWENNNYVLFKNMTDEEFANSNNLSVLSLVEKVSLWKKRLFEERAKRERPRTDNKVLTSWNGLMLKAYVDAYRVLGNNDYLDKALKSAEFIKENQLRKEGGLFHNYKNKITSIEGFSEDYASIISAYISLYEVTLDEDWLKLSRRILDYTITHFFDKNNGMFYFTPDSETTLITRRIEIVDDVIPSSNSMLAESLFKLSHFYSNEDYKNIARQMLSNMKDNIGKSPSSFSNWLSLYLNYSNPYYEVAVSGEKALDKLKELNKYYLPNILIAGALAESEVPIMRNRFNEGETYIYVCVDGTCKLPVKSVDSAVNQLFK